MTQGSELKTTMQTVMDGHRIVRQFHQNVADMFRALGHILEDSDPAYELLSNEGNVWTATLSHHLRTADRWDSHHFCAAYAPIEEHDLPILLVNVSVDTRFSSQPELWLGVVAELETTEPFPYEDTVKYLYVEYFGPDEEWTETGEWYEETIDDERVRAFVSFMRIPLVGVDGLVALENNVCQSLLERVHDVTQEDSE